MKIAYIAAGAAGMYCGSCIRDNTLAKALIARGHDVALIPTYTPLRTDEPGVAIEKVFYNGISVYLEQKFAWLRSGRFNLDRILNSSRVLNYLSKVNASTNARDLGELTVSMLKGEDGNQALELEKLVTWLRDEYKPDLVQITNSMLAGLAKRFKEELKVPVLCALQGEDIFLDDLTEPYKTQAMQLLQQKVLDCDALVATSSFYADYMAGYLNVPREKIHVVKLGLNLEGHGEGEIVRDSERLTIGYLARICPEKGLHILLDAFAKIRKDHPKLNVCLKAAGYLGARDEQYLKDLQEKARGLGLEDDFEYIGEVSREEKIVFLQSLDVFSVPTPYKEPKGLFLLEAMANRVPVVQPAHGAFPEMLSTTEGGLLIEPGNSDTLAEALVELLKDPSRCREMGETGARGVREHYTSEHMAIASEKLYQSFIEN